MLVKALGSVLFAIKQFRPEVTPLFSSNKMFHANATIDTSPQILSSCPQMLLTLTTAEPSLSENYAITAWTTTPEETAASQ